MHVLSICTKNQEILVRNQMDHRYIVEFDLKGNSYTRVTKEGPQ